MSQQSALSLAKVKSWLAASDAIGLPLITFALVWPVATGFLVGETEGAEFSFSIHFFDLLGSGIAASTLLLLRLLMKRIRARRSAVATLSVLVLAAFFGSLLPVVIVESFSAVPQIYRDSVPFGFFSILATSLTFIFIWSAVSEQRSALRSLATARKSLSFLKANLESEIAENRKILKEQILAVLEPAFVQLNEELTSGASEQTLASRLKGAIDEVVRPLSHELAESKDLPDGHALQTIHQFEKSIIRMPFRDRWSQRVLLVEAVSIPLVVLAHVIFIIPSTVFLNGSQGFVAAAAALFAITLANFGFTKLASKRSALYFQVLATALALGLVSAGIYSMLLSLLVPNSDASFILAVATSVLIANFVTGFFGCQLSIRRSSLAAAAEANSNLQGAVNQLKQDAWLNRRRLARAIHGSVQANLQSAAIRLIRGSQTGEVNLDALTEQMTQSLDVALAARTEQPGLISSLESLKEFWSGACDLTIAASTDLLLKIEVDQHASECLYELISEAVSNAVKHAGADEVDVQITQADDEIRVEIRNPLGEGASSEKANAAGLGSRIYDEISDAWSLDFVDGDAVLKATLSMPKN